MAASSSTENKSVVPSKEKYHLYPYPVARYEDVVASPKLFMDILTKFHVAMGTKFKIPIVGGRDLDLHRLFVEVTSRGGIKKVLDDKKWREVTNGFNFPPSATNASFILRKYYMSLIHHFEQVYYFKAKAYTPFDTDTWQGAITSGINMPEIRNPSPEVQVTSMKRQRMTSDDSLYRGSVESPIGLPVSGIIDGKFESGYLCTVRIGGEQLQGVLYQTVQTTSSNQMIPNHAGVVTMDATQGSTMVSCRRRRRKKSEMRKRDPAHPKPNRSGYNFFFAEQHARLKLLHTSKDRAISRMIGEEWNKLTESDKAVYQEKAVKDKERYKREMEHYREGFNKGQVLTNALPVSQHYYMMDNTSMIGVKNNGGIANQVQDTNSEFSDADDDSSFEDEEKTAVKEDSNLEMEAENIDIEMKPQEKILISLNIEDDQSVFFGSGQQKSMYVQENESSRIHEIEVKQDRKSPDDEHIIPDIYKGNDTKE
ncbi:high mobility group B protein 15-like [Rutidosis leptorrhynchoides]|uniref:high mobility group B protein 15-like n=1 Tax=Rutidosis leptorrhynchoides TaxID=125765 RepID=UPI003A99D79F